MNIKYFGQSTFIIEFGGKRLLFDPFITGNPLVEEKNLESISVDYILLSHGHGDHVADAEAIAKNNNATIISTYEIVEWFQQKGISGHPMNIGGEWQFDFGKVKMVNAVHSSVLPDGTYGGNPVGFLITNDKESLYFAGDTALTMDMHLIKMFCPTLQVAILPIGSNFTMGISDAVIAAEWIGCDQIIGCHYDTFGYIKIDHKSAKDAFAKKGKLLTLLPLGDSIQL